jgi:hypothetical protein
MIHRFELTQNLSVGLIIMAVIYYRKLLKILACDNLSNSQSTIIAILRGALQCINI